MIVDSALYRDGARVPVECHPHEFDVLRHLEVECLPAVRPAGLVTQPDHDVAILLTRYLVGSWQYRRLIARLPPNRPAHRARLFDPFFRGDPSRTDGGSGLGLAICRAIVAAHGGTIALGRPASGTEVHVRLPVARVVAGVPETWMLQDAPSP